MILVDVFNLKGGKEKLIRFEFLIFCGGLILFFLAVVFCGFSLFKALDSHNHELPTKIKNHQKNISVPEFISGQNLLTNDEPIVSDTKDISLDFETYRDDIFNFLCDNGRAGEALMFYQGANSSSFSNVGFLDKTLRKVAQEKMTFMSYWNNCSKRERVELYHKSRDNNCLKLSLLLENDQPIELPVFINLLPRILQPLFVHNLQLRASGKIEEFYFQQRLSKLNYSQKLQFKGQPRIEYADYIKRDIDLFKSKQIVKPLINAFLISQEYYSRSSQLWLQEFLPQSFKDIHPGSSYETLKSCWNLLPEWCKYQIKINIPAVDSNRSNIRAFNKFIFTTNCREEELDVSLLKVVRSHPLWLEALQKFKYALALRHLPLIFENAGFKNRKDRLIPKITAGLIKEQKLMNKNFAWGFYAKVLMLSELYPPHLSGQKNSQQPGKLYWNDVPDWIFYSLMHYKKQYKEAEIFRENRSLIEIK